MTTSSTEYWWSCICICICNWCETPPKKVKRTLEQVQSSATKHGLGVGAHDVQGQAEGTMSVQSGEVKVRWMVSGCSHPLPKWESYRQDEVSRSKQAQAATEFPMDTGKSFFLMRVVQPWDQAYTRQEVSILTSFPNLPAQSTQQPDECVLLGAGHWTRYFQRSIPK